MAKKTVRIKVQGLDGLMANLRIEEGTLAVDLGGGKDVRVFRVAANGSLSEVRGTERVKAGAAYSLRKNTAEAGRR
jgi:hypothetical protein